jgi:hypothetical protein
MMFNLIFGLTVLAIVAFWTPYDFGSVIIAAGAGAFIQTWWLSRLGWKRRK